MFIKITTQAVDNWCIPFGVVIGPCTVMSNGCKLVWDVVKLSFHALLLVNYTPTQPYYNFRGHYELYSCVYSIRYAPPLWGDINTITTKFGSRKEENQEIFRPIGTPTFEAYRKAHRALSFRDRIYFAFEQEKKDAAEHITFIGIGAIRTIPLFGGIARSIWNKKRKNFKKDLGRSIFSTERFLCK